MIFGYLDPGTGSLILQAALGGIAGIAVAFKAWKARIMSKKAVAAAEDPETTTDESAVEDPETSTDESAVTSES
jgi:hypothetical protein